MSKVRKTIVGLLISSILLISSSQYISADSKIPPKIRIGLNSSSKFAMSVFSVSASKGLQFGMMNNSCFNVIFEDVSSNSYTVRKDGYFYKLNGVFKEYDPGSTTTVQGEKYGPYHIKIGVNYMDLISANIQVQLLQKSGIAAYPVFVDNKVWQIWSGFYADKNSAQADITSRLSIAAPSTAFTLLPLYTKDVFVYDSKATLVFGYSGEIGAFQVHPEAVNDPYMLKLNSKCYRGDLEISRMQGYDMTIINILPLDQYLYSVVSYEIGGSSPIEAQKAQALAARTYAIANLKKHAKQGFDLCDYIDCQAYGGYGMETTLSRQAVDSTTCQVITYNSKPISAVYSSSTGGFTEDVANVWGGDPPAPYLKSVDDSYEAFVTNKGSYYNWENKFTFDELTTLFKGKGYNIGDIVSICITKKSAVGRATEVVVQGTLDKKTYVREGCRTFLGLKSQWYTITTDADVIVGEGKAKMQLAGKSVISSSGTSKLKTIKQSISVLGANGLEKSYSTVPTSFDFKGKGYGHAVGMSQIGAMGMAIKGFTYDQIIKHYYTGVDIQNY